MTELSGGEPELFLMVKQAVVLVLLVWPSEEAQAFVQRGLLVVPEFQAALPAELGLLAPVLPTVFVVRVAWEGACASGLQAEKQGLPVLGLKAVLAAAVLVVLVLKVPVVRAAREAVCAEGLLAEKQGLPVLGLKAVLAVAVLVEPTLED